MEIPTFTGVLDKLPSPTDFIAGSVSGIQYEITNPSGDWSSFIPQGETQIGIGGDTFACVTFSALDALETIQRSRGNDVNYSDRFTAKVSGTTIQGNYLQKVADSIRHDGVVPETDWSWSPRQRDPEFTWAKFYEDIPSNVISEGSKFASEHDIQYEWVSTDTESLKTHLKQSPLQIVTKVCGGWNNGDQTPVKGCGISNQHATLLYKIDERGYHILDHYDPFTKILSLDYGIACAMKYIIKAKSNTPMLEHGKGKLVRNAQTGAYGLNLGDEILDAGTDRTALLALDTLQRNGFGVTISDQDWKSVPHRPF